LLYTLTKPSSAFPDTWQSPFTWKKVLRKRPRSNSSSSLLYKRRTDSAGEAALAPSASKVSNGAGRASEGRDQVSGSASAIGGGESTTTTRDDVWRPRCWRVQSWVSWVGGSVWTSQTCAWQTINFASSICSLKKVRSRDSLLHLISEKFRRKRWCRAAPHELCLRWRYGCWDKMIKLWQNPAPERHHYNQSWDQDVQWLRNRSRTCGLIRNDQNWSEAKDRSQYSLSVSSLELKASTWSGYTPDIPYRNMECGNPEHQKPPDIEHYDLPKMGFFGLPWVNSE